ncbi:hypothetical protein ACJRO7_031844 [Eucalyptus globulus]|uniref:Uncharacterized protein n=1 Tax=Eucalyptus globulus TaxID=34317 RepID=A0ABD3JU41_EUCGL
MFLKYLLVLFLGLVLLTITIAVELDHRHHPFKKERPPKEHKPPHKHHPCGGRLLLEYAKEDGHKPFPKQKSPHHHHPHASSSLLNFFLKKAGYVRIEIIYFDIESTLILCISSKLYMYSNINEYMDKIDLYCKFFYE